MYPDQHRANAELQNTGNNSQATQLLQIGLSHHRAGDFTKAEASYRQALGIRPNHPDALHLLGVIAHQGGRLSEAAELIRHAVREISRRVAFYSNLGNALRNHGKVNQAGTADHRAALIMPALAEAYSNLGTVLRAQGKLDDAAAAYHRAIGISPNYAEAHSCLGVVLRDQGKLNDSVAAHREAVRLNPDCAQFYSNLGNALRDQGKLDEAIAVCRRAIEIEPDFPEFWSNLGNALLDQGKLDEAVAAHRQAIRIRPDRAELHFNLGVVLHHQGKYDEALAVHRQAVILKPNFVDAHNAIATALIELGRCSESRAVLEEAIRWAPRSAKCRRTLGELVRFAAGDPHLTALEHLNEDATSLSISDRIELHFGLAKAYDDVGRYAEAFRHWCNGGVLKRGQITYNEAATLEVMNRCRAVFSSERLQGSQNLGQPAAVPVFIVGMPRSGSTLIEQILASHPMVFGGGEMKHLGAAVRSIARNRGGAQKFPELALDMTNDDFRELGAHYLAEIARLAPAARRITDKMPTNFILVGVIHLALPNAVIIHARRHPVDTCLSCFSRLFAANQYHTYDLAELGRYYRHYHVLMVHWQSVLPPGRILDVRYENVVDDLEGEARRIVAHCGLEWDERCLAFHQTVRPIRTSSAAQVRQPIYSGSIGRWRPYEQFLAPLFAELGDDGNPD